MPDFYPWWNQWDPVLALKNFCRSLGHTWHNFTVEMKNGGVILLVSWFSGAAVIPIITTTRTIGNMLVQMSSILTNPLTAELIKFESKEEPRKTLETIKMTWLLTGTMTSILFLALFLIPFNP